MMEEPKRYTDFTREEKRLYHKEKNRERYLKMRGEPKVVDPNIRTYQDFSDAEKKEYHRLRYNAWYASKGGKRLREITRAKRIVELEDLGYTVTCPVVST